MLNSWEKALNEYSYCVKLKNYERASEFSSFFDQSISGDRESTIALEKHFRTNAEDNIEAFFEVIYWKLYTQGGRGEHRTNEIVDFIQKEEITSEELWDSIQKFIESPEKDNLQNIRDMLGLTTPVLAVPLTLVAFANPKKFPMIDNRVASWINENYSDHNANKRNKLTPFKKNYNVLRDNDFDNYLNWIYWSREVAQILTKKTELNWRARDVEMAIFTAQQSDKLHLDVLP